MKSKDLQLLSEAYSLVSELARSAVEAEPLEDTPTTKLKVKGTTKIVELSMNMLYKRANSLIDRKTKKNPHAGVDMVINLIRDNFNIVDKKGFRDFFKKVETNAKIEDTIHSTTFVQKTEPILKQRLEELKLI